jgi:hypothetical protein
MSGIITAERVRQLPHYDPDTGVLTRLISTNGDARAGEVVRGVCDGYLTARIDGRRYQAHRLAWLYMIGEWPKANMDHVNGDRADNRWCNLREATNSQNQANTPNAGKQFVRIQRLNHKRSRYRREVGGGFWQFCRIPPPTRIPPAFRCMDLTQLR